MFVVSPVQAAIAIAVPFVLLLLAVALLSIHRIGPNEVGLVIRRWGPRRAQGGPIAFQGEAGPDILVTGSGGDATSAGGIGLLGGFLRAFQRQAAVGSPAPK